MDAADRGLRPPGYLLQVEPDRVDLCQFDRLLVRAREARAAGELAGAAVALGSALALWRGPALADVASQVLRAVEGRRLEERRLGALEARIELDLPCHPFLAVVNASDTWFSKNGVHHGAWRWAIRSSVR